jgi:hypothetical protein
MLLESDKPKRYEEFDGVPTSAELDKESKEYMDANKIFKQLKSAFNPTSPFSQREDDDSNTSAMSKTTVGGTKKTSLEPILEETALITDA